MSLRGRPIVISVLLHRRAPINVYDGAKASETSRQKTPT